MKKRRGFSLVELLVVIAVITLLATVIYPQLNTARERARIARAQTEIANINNVFELIVDDTGLYPNGDFDVCRDPAPANNEVDLLATTSGITGNGSGWPNWQGPYLSDVTDPWGTPYFLDEDYQCMASTTGCKGIDDAGQDSSVIVSCGPNMDTSGANGSCAYDDDNIVFRLSCN